MQSWLKISLLLCLFGFLKELRPSEPYIYEFLIGEWRNVTDAQVNQEVYPVGTYAYLAQLVIVFLITDLSRYKPLIILLGASGVVVWGMLLWTKSLWELQVLEVFYGTFMATEVAYYTYIYAKVDREYFQKVTSHTRAAILAGRTISGVLAQALVSSSVMDYRQLNYITFGAMICATIWSILLPSVKTSIYFHQPPEMEGLTTNQYKKAFNLMRAHFAESFSRRRVIKWSCWWALATCGFVQVQTYQQPLWSAVEGDEESKGYNGAVEAILTLLGFLGALLAGFIRTDWTHKGELLLSFCSIIAGGLMIFSSQTSNVMYCYGCYIVFGAMYHFVITVASSEIAKDIKEDSYGLVFGLNTLIALLLQSGLTLVVVSKSGFGLAPRDQFLVYGFYHLAIACVYIFIGLWNWLRSKGDSKKTYR